MTYCEERGTFRHPWKEGPWDGEPNSVEWLDDNTGLPCLIERTRLGYLCGYVGVADRHPWFEKHPSLIEEVVDVHGGLNHALKRRGSGCWWVGFDCAHVGDAVPLWAVPDRPLEGTYRGIEYARAEVQKLALQASRVGSKP